MEGAEGHMLESSAQRVTVHVEQREDSPEQQEETRESQNHCGLAQTLQPTNHPKHAFLFSIQNIYCSFYSARHNAKLL